MSERLIKPYEISVWEDKLTNGVFEETKLAVIGSDTMTGLNKVYDPVFNKKINGEKTLSFSLKYKYFDPYTGNDGIVNPFAALLINERKVKLHYDDEWYEFIVKDHSESSDGLEWTYTCTDAYVLELSKSGYNITFDSELNNNQGTVLELAKETLKDTDWRVGTADVGKQLIAEPVYLATLVSNEDININIINVDTNAVVEFDDDTSIYLFYSYIKNQDGKFVQFIIRDENYIVDDNNVITDTNYRIKDELVYDAENYCFKLNDNIVIQLVKENNNPKIETRYQANRVAYGQRTTYDPVMGKTVDIFKTGDREIYKYTDYSYTTSNVVTNLITNGDNFNSLEDGSIQGWNPYVGGALPDTSVIKPELVTRPELGTGKPLADILILSQIEGFLKVDFSNTLKEAHHKTIFNSGIENNASTITSIAKGDEFVFRWRAGVGTDVNHLTPTNKLRLLVARYAQETPNPYTRYYKHIDENNIIMEFKTATLEEEIPPLNNYIRGGTLKDNSYYIDGVAQPPSTKYIYVSNNKEYVWDTNAREFVLKTSANYAPYYYLKATATKAISNKDLSDPKQKFGIFVYMADDTDSVYIQEIQLTRFVADADGRPILVGNIPTATAKQNDYYYLKPVNGSAAEDVETYTSLSELAEDIGIDASTIKPVYNEDSEKVLSISASQSNCFNILQTIAETFECWVDLVVGHDANGYITKTNGLLNKYVYLKEFAGKDNWAGFKYGINVNSIERTVNSDEIVTKLIVDQSQSDYTDEGFVSIASAPSNQSGESYILNFDYYYNQGLLNKAEAEPDRLRFISEIAELNRQLKIKNEQQRNLSASLTQLESNLNVYTELVDTAKDTQTDSLAEFENLTGQTYKAYKDKHPTLASDKQLTEEETILETLGKIYTSSAVINNYSGLLSNIEQEYSEVYDKLYGSDDYVVKVWVDRDVNDVRHVIIELSDYLPGFAFKIGDYNGAGTVSVKRWDRETNATSITFTAPSPYEISKTSYTINDSKIAKFKISSGDTIFGIEDEIEDIQDEKDALTKEFNTKYSRYIQEGTWSSTEYIDPELYYLDALQVSNTSAQPTVSYTINVVEVSELEGLENYLFEVGDKTYIEDTEFFGWSNVDGYLTPAREEVIVSEVEWHLEEPENNVITVQNYKTRFEDLFQRISAAVQTVQYNEASYAKMSSLLDANGTLNQNVLLDSLNKISGQNYNLTSDGSVVINGDQILVRNLTNPANRVIINSEGIRISSDGGQTWKTAINGQGINIGAVYTGTLNTENVIIGSSDNPSFRWDKSGISAYQLGDNGVYNLQTFVRYDQFGLYGIKNKSVFKAETIDDVKEKAHFGITWDGFFIKNVYEGGGQVEITSENDFRVLNKVNGKDNEKIKIGALEWKDKNGNITTNPAEGVGAPTLYGIRIKNNDGVEVMKTDDNGDLIIVGTIDAMAANFSNVVTVGKNDVTTPNWIVIDGVKSAIQTSDYSDGAGRGWMINKDGDAVFNNITARGAIKTAVFEYAEIQAVGGIFLFRPSSTIKSARIGDPTKPKDVSNPNGDKESINDLIVTVENPLLFARVLYYQISNVKGTDNPQANGWYERTNYGYQLTQDTVAVADKPYFRMSSEDTGSWCKVSNYITNGVASDSTIQNILQTNGLTHVYKVTHINLNKKEVTLEGAAVMVTGNSPVTTLAELEGGALIDMGRENRTSNYGIGVNSSDNTVNLPARAISLFETVIDKTAGTIYPRVTYNYKGILGTLPVLEYTGDKPLVNQLYHENLEGTQGIYTSNMYIGDDTQYIAFYTGHQDNKKYLKVNTKELTLKAGSFVQALSPEESSTDSSTETTNSESSYFVYLSNNDYAGENGEGIKINNSTNKKDWRLIIGSKFGVDKTGKLYASNATIEGHIQATSGSFGDPKLPGGPGATFDENGNFIVKQSAVENLDESFNTVMKEASDKGYTLYVEVTSETESSVTLTAHVYYGNKDITEHVDDGLFLWKRRDENSTQTTSLEAHTKTITFNKDDAGYGTTIICSLALRDDVILRTPNWYAVATPDDYLLLAHAL